MTLPLHSFAFLMRLERVRAVAASKALLIDRSDARNTVMQMRENKLKARHAGRLARRVSRRDLDRATWGDYAAKKQGLEKSKNLRMIMDEHDHMDELDGLSSDAAAIEDLS